MSLIEVCVMIGDTARIYEREITMDLIAIFHRIRFFKVQELQRLEVNVQNGCDFCNQFQTS